MELEIKIATKEDFGDLQKLSLMLFAKEHREYDPTLNSYWTLDKDGRKFLKESIKNKDACVLIARCGKEAVGYLIGWINRKKNSCRTLNLQAKLHNMFVIDEYRRQEIGKSMVSKFLEWAKSKKVDNVFVVTYAANGEALNFYHKAGFKDYAHAMEIDL